jgi:hypothetical protein
MSHRTLLTATNTVVSHSHSTSDWTSADKATYQADTLASYSGIQPVEYVHLDHSSEELLPTTKYNCWGFTFNPRQCWINSGVDVQNILNDNGTQVFAPNLRIGDVICYRDNQNVITHTGRVWGVSGSGQASWIQSKWGSLGEYLHAPFTVPKIYGSNVSYWRVTPLKGKGDAWHKDNAADDRLPCAPGVRWLSPDLWCNNAGGTTHQDPVRAQQNQLYARLHNPDTLNINNASIRFYWADPNGGIPHTNWNLIGTAPVSVSTGTFAIAGPVPWTPGPAVPAHSCLLAIADTGDDPCAAATQDPIVWPFDVSRDNNIVQRNIAVITLPPAPMPRPITLPYAALNPSPLEARIDVLVDLQYVTPKELGGLGLDLKVLAPLLERWTQRHRWPRRVIRPRPGLALDVETEGKVWRTEGGRVYSRGLVITTRPVPSGGGGHVKLMLTPTEAARPGQCYRIDVGQRVDGQVTGGITYIVLVIDEKRESALDCG